MGRRQWKHYQEQLTRSHLNIEEQQPIAIAGSEDEPPQYKPSSKEPNHCETENHRLEQHHNGSQLLEEDFGGLYDTYIIPRRLLNIFGFPFLREQPNITRFITYTNTGSHQYTITTARTHRLETVGQVQFLC